jgi:hypothetical protein
MTKLRPFGTASSGGRLDDFGGHEVAVSLNLDPWWDEPEYKTCNTLRLRGAFILQKVREHDPAKFQDVMTDLYRDDQPDPQDIGTFEWQTILTFMGASEEEIRDVQLRMGRVWR